MEEEKIKEKEEKKEDDQSKSLKANDKDKVICKIIKASDIINKESDPFYRIFQNFLHARAFKNNKINSAIERAIKSSMKSIQKDQLGHTKLMELYPNITDLENIGEDPIKLWQILKSFGYDLWLNKTSRNIFIGAESEVSLNMQQLKEIMNWVMIDLCKEMKTILVYPAKNLREPMISNILFPGTDYDSLNY